MGLKYGGRPLPADRATRRTATPSSDARHARPYHGQATGIFTCDEHLAGRSPSQGTELCTVVEAMYSLELLAGITGDARLGDRLEKLAFNALPATFKKDMTAHQYDQQGNQVVCKVPSRAGLHEQRRRREPLRPGAELRLLHGEHASGLAQVRDPPLGEDRRRRPGGAGRYAPCVVETKIQGKPVKVEVVTDYPFSRPRDHRGHGPRADDVPAPPSRPGVGEGSRRSSRMTPVTVTPGQFVEVRKQWAAGKHEIAVRFPMPVTLYRASTTPSPSSAARSSTR